MRPLIAKITCHNNIRSFPRGINPDGYRPETVFSSWPWADSLETNDLHDRLASSLHSISALKDSQLEAKYIKCNLNYHIVCYYGMWIGT